MLGVVAAGCAAFISTQLCPYEPILGGECVARSIVERSEQSGRLRSKLGSGRRVVIRKQTPAEPYCPSELGKKAKVATTFE